MRRFQIWIFQDFVRTLAAVDIKPTQYSVLTVIGANPGLSQMAVAQRLGIERARLVHLLDSLEDAQAGEARPLADRPAVARAASDRARTRHRLRQFKLLAAEHERHVAEKIGTENREAVASDTLIVHLTACAAARTAMRQARWRGSVSPPIEARLARPNAARPAA